MYLLILDKGPVVPPSSSADLAKFLEAFFNLNLFITGTPKLLSLFSERSKAELASCNVAWWAAASLSDLRFNGSGLYSSGSVAEPVGKGWGHHRSFSRQMYMAVHGAMGVSIKVNLSGYAVV
jgi:hypothetical protein